MKNMDKMMITVSTVVGSLGLLSAILGFSAEGTKITPSDIRIYGNACIYPPNPALGLALCAVVFLLVAQIMVAVAGGCCGCCKSRSSAAPSETKRIIGIVCAVISWIAAGVAWALLLYGAELNANVARSTSTLCPYLKDGVFAGAAVLTLAATALGVTSYIVLRGQRTPDAEAPAASSTGAPDNKPQQPAGPGIATGNTQTPPPQGLPQHQQSTSPSYDSTAQGAQDQGHEGQAQFPPPEGCSVQSDVPQGSGQISSENVLNTVTKVGVEVLKEMLKESLSPDADNIDSIALAGGIIGSVVTNLAS